MKKIDLFSKIKGIVIAINFLIVFSANAQVAAFDSDTPVATFATSYSQAFNTPWDGTTFYDQWEALTANSFSAADITSGYFCCIGLVGRLKCGWSGC
jgi:hypothetical protein